MPSPSTTIQPPLSIAYVAVNQSLGYNSWLSWQLSGVPCPGTLIRPGGVQGFKRETGWDIKKGKGTEGATLTLKDMPPCEGTFTNQLITPTDLSDWDDFVYAVLSISTKDQQADGLSVFYPGLSSIGLTAVVVKDYTPVIYMGGGKYHVSVTLIEWNPPPNISIVKTVAATAPDQDMPDTPPTEDPRITALQAQIAAVQGNPP
jgi:hypothetical protein